ncbi:hypothetical protein ACIBHY_28810 [Nonomuraea sp. NPDC050547]
MERLHQRRSAGDGSRDALAFGLELGTAQADRALGGDEDQT